MFRKLIFLPLMLAATSVVAETNVVAVTAGTNAVKRVKRPAKVTSASTYYDRKEGIAVFTGKVHVDDEEYQMHADKAFLFLSGTNDLKRIVAIGNVAITNDTRVGGCAMAKFWKRSSEIEMFGDGRSLLARMTDEQGNDLQGSRIRFWLDSEQVDVENPEIQVNRQEGGRIP